MPLLPGPDEGFDGRDRDGLPPRPQPAAPLSAWERDVLSRVEADLTGADPALAEQMSRLGAVQAASLPPAARRLLRAVAGLIALAVVVALLTPVGWAVLALVAILVAPRLLLLAIVGRIGR